LEGSFMPVKDPYDIVDNPFISRVIEDVAPQF
jgi:hypothetical protein